MSKKSVSTPPELGFFDTMKVVQFANIFTLDEVKSALKSHGCETVRVRLLPNLWLVYLQMLQALFRECSQRSVYRTVAAALEILESIGGAKTIPTAAAITKGLDRLKPEVFQALHRKLAVPVGKPGDKGMWFKHWRTVSMDGFTMDVEDTRKNRKFFDSPSNQHGSASLPQLRCVCFVETGSHLIIEASLGGYKDGEISLALPLIPLIEPNWIMLADRNFYSFEFYRRLTEEVGAALLFRIQRGMSLKSDQRLADGSHLVTIYDSGDRRKENGLPARVIQYKLRGTKKRQHETIYLITNILDPEEATAQDLATLYHERWEHESTLDELKTHLNLSSLTLRSKNPERVLQELWGMLMAHYALRSLMYGAAVHARIDPDRLSFTHAVDVVKDALVMEKNAHCTECGNYNSVSTERILKEVLGEQLPMRRARTRKRSARRREKYAPRKGREKQFKKTNHKVYIKSGWDYKRRSKPASKS